MTRRLFDFWCSYCEYTFDDLVDDSIEEIECPNCTLKAKRVISPVRIDWRKMGIDPDFPTCFKRWGDAHTPSDKE